MYQCQYRSRLWTLLKPLTLVALCTTFTLLTLADDALVLIEPE